MKRPSKITFSFLLLAASICYSAWCQDVPEVGREAIAKHFLPEAVTFDVIRKTHGLPRVHTNDVTRVTIPSGDTMGSNFLFRVARQMDENGAWGAAFLNAVLFDGNLIYTVSEFPDVKDSCAKNLKKLLSAATLDARIGVDSLLDLRASELEQFLNKKDKVTLGSFIGRYATAKYDPLDLCFSYADAGDKNQTILLFFGTGNLAIDDDINGEKLLLSAAATKSSGEVVRFIFRRGVAQ